jgi:dehydrogenase/reductase SDR family member 12
LTAAESRFPSAAVPLHAEVQIRGGGCRAGCRGSALAEEWTQHLLDTGITVDAMHPGWANTPGLRSALSGFSRVVGPLLRTPGEGADTIVWLAAAPDAADLSGLFFLDRRARAKHRLRRTRRPDAARQAERLWRVCTERTARFTADTSAV